MFAPCEDVSTPLGPRVGLPGIVAPIRNFGSRRSANVRPFLALLWFWLLAMGQPASQAVDSEAFSAGAISSGERFLAELFDPGLDLLPEYAGAKVYWLYHDNYLAAKLLKPSHPALAKRIETAMHSFGVSHSGKIEILFNQATNAFPFRNYELLDVTNIAGKLIRTERVTEKVLKGWDAYADLLFMGAIAKSTSAPEEAKRYFEKGLALWDGRGFADPAFKKGNLYASYKLALAILAADVLKQKLPFRSDALQQLRKLQSSTGGWITDYSQDGQPHGLANVETTCLVLMALHTH